MDETVRMDIKKKKNRSDGEVEIHVKKKGWSSEKKKLEKSRCLYIHIYIIRE